MVKSGALVSVVIPARNAEATLVRTLWSVSNQTYKPIEVIVVDDGSTDNTAHLAKEYGQALPNFKLIRQQAMGLSAARNAGIAASSGEYIAPLDADDIWNPTKLAKQVERIKESPECGIVYTFVRYINNNDSIMMDGNPQIFPRRAHARHLYESLIGGGSSVLVKKKALEEVGGYDPSWDCWEDLGLQLKIASRYELEVIPEYLVGYRVTIGSLTSDIDRMLAGWRKARSTFMDIFPQIPSSVHSCAHGSRCLMFAQRFWSQGRFFKCLILLIEAIIFDPKKIACLLLDKGSRIFRCSTPGQQSRNLFFYDGDPKLSIHPQLNGPCVSRLETRRCADLAVIDTLLT